MKCSKCGLVYAKGPNVQGCPRCSPPQAVRKAAVGELQNAPEVERASSPIPYEWLAEQSLLFEVEPRELHDDVRAALVESLKRGDPVRNAVYRVADAYTGRGLEPDYEFCEDVAHTELLRAMNATSFLRLLASDAKRKEWLSGSTCRHRGMDGKKMPVGEPFIVHGHPMMYPGDARQAPLKEVLRCGCTISAVFD